MRSTNDSMCEQTTGIFSVYVTSQQDMNASHFLPLDIASTCIITSVLFLWGNNLNEIVIDAGVDLFLESYPKHTPLLKWQSLVCVCHEGS